MTKERPLDERAEPVPIGPFAIAEAFLERRDGVGRNTGALAGGSRRPYIPLRMSPDKRSRINTTMECDLVPVGLPQPGRSYVCMDFPIEHMASMEQRLRQQGWLIVDKVPPADFVIPPISPGFCRRYGIDWVGPQ